VPANRTLDGLEQVFARRLASTKTLQRQSHIVERGGSYDDITSAIVRAQKSSAASSDEALGVT
jgi:hypothetical protein